MKVFSKDEILRLVRDKAMSPKDAFEALKAEPEEADTLDDIKKLVKDAIEKFSTQNNKLIELAKLDSARPEGAEAVINALQSQTETLIKALKSLEEKPIEKKKWKLETESIERGRDGKVTSMEVSAVQV